MKRMHASVPASIASGICAVIAACSSSSHPSGSACEGSCTSQDGSADQQVDTAVGNEASDVAETSLTEGSADAVSDGSDASEAADVGPDAAPDDPCPSQTNNYVNCSSTCGSSSNCSTLSCGSMAVPIELTSWSQLPFVIRTPSQPGSDPACPTDCGVPEVYALTFLANLPAMTPAADLEVTVGAPWNVSIFSGVTGGPSCPGSAKPCLVSPGQSPVIGVWTSDPNAPARNVVISKTTMMCP